MNNLKEEMKISCIGSNLLEQKYPSDMTNMFPPIIDRRKTFATIHTKSFSIAFLTVVIWLDNSLDSPVVTLAEMTALETLQARPRAALEGKKM